MVASLARRRSGCARRQAQRGSFALSISADVALFLDLGRFADPIAQVVQLGASDVAFSDPLNLGDYRRMDRKRPLDPDPETDLADREGLADTGALTPDGGALEHLH